MSVVFPINPDDRVEDYTASAGQTVFSVPFPFQDDRDVQVIKIAVADGVTTVLVDGADYALSGAGDEGPGSCVLATGLAVGDKLRLIGAVVLDRLTSIVRNGRYSSRAQDDEHDRHRLVQQELARDSKRGLKVDYGQSGPTMDLSGFVAGNTLMLGDDNEIVHGPDAADIASAQGYAEDASASKDLAATARDEAVAAAAMFTKATGAEVIAGVDDVKYLTSAGVAAAYINFNRMITTVEGLVRTDDTSSITAAQVNAGLAADSAIRELKFLGRDYTFTDAGIVLPADRAFTVTCAGMGATHIEFGAAAGFVYNVTTQAENAQRQFNFNGGASIKASYAGVTGFNVSWNNFPFALWNSGQIENVYFYVENGSSHFNQFVKANHASRLALVDLDGKNARTGVAGVGYQFTGYALDCDIVRCRDSYVSNGILVSKYSGSLITLSSGSGTWTTGDTLTFSNGAVGMIMGMIDATEASPDFFAEILSGSTPSVSDTVEVTATQLGSTGATGTVDAISARSWGQEGFKITGGEDVGVQRGIYLEGDADTAKKLNNTQIHNRHINASVECIAASFATVIDAKGLDLQIGGNITALVLTSCERSQFQGVITQAAAGGIGYGVLASVGAATYGTEACDDIQCHFETNDLLGTEYTTGAGVTNFEFNGGPDQDLKTWAATVVSQTGTLTSYTQSCFWQEENNTAIASIDITITNHGTGSDALRVYLPGGHILAAACSGMIKNETTGAGCYVDGAAGNTYVDIRRYDAASIIATGTRVKGSFSYFIT